MIKDAGAKGRSDGARDASATPTDRHILDLKSSIGNIMKRVQELQDRQDGTDSGKRKRIDEDQPRGKSRDRRGQDDRRGQRTQSGRPGNPRAKDSQHGGPDGQYAGYAKQQSKKSKTNKSSHKPARNLHESGSETDLDYISGSE